MPIGLTLIDPLISKAKTLKLKQAEARIVSHMAVMRWYTDHDAPKCLRAMLYCLDLVNTFLDKEYPEN